MKNSLCILLAGLAVSQLAPPSLSQSTLTKIDLAAAVPLDSWPKGPSDPADASIFESMVEFNGEYYFKAYSPDVGMELFKTNGLPGGAQLVNDFAPGPGFSAIGEMAVVGGRLYLSASDDPGGVELWSTGGTPATTQSEYDILPGSNSSFPRWLTPVGSKLYFTADTPGAGNELIVLDTAPGVLPALIDILPGTTSSVPKWLIPNPSGVGVLFQARDANSGFELWKSNGTMAGTRKLADLSPGPGHGRFEYPVALGGGVVFLGTSPSTGQELYFTDGTSAGTMLLADIEPGSASSEIELNDEAILGGVLYFAATNAAVGRELYRTDGTVAGTFLVTDALPGVEGSSPNPIGVAGGKLVVHATVDPVSIGTEFYSLEPSGLVLLKDLAPGSSSSTVVDAERVGVNLLFGGGSELAGRALWITDGTPAGTNLVSSMGNTPLALPRSITAISPTMAIFGGFDSNVGGELFRTSGTGATTFPIGDIASGFKHVNSSPKALVSTSGDDLYLAIDGTSSDYGRWNVSEGYTVLAAKSSLVFGESHWIGDRYVRFFTAGHALSSGDYSDLYMTDGTAAGTSIVTDAAGTLLGARQVLSSDGVRTLFVGFDAASGGELWSTDGTAAGTFRVIDLDPGAGSGFYEHDGKAVRLGDWVFVEASNGSGGSALWKTDGTAANTTLVKDINPGGFVNIFSWAVYQGRVLFSADDGVSGQEVWSTDGTTAGTFLVKDITPGTAGFPPVEFVELGGLLYFLAGTAVPGQMAIWGTDGTTAGTQLAADVSSLYNGSGVNLVKAGGKLYFDSQEAATGRELWMFDGVTASLVRDLNPGPGSSEVREIYSCGSRVYFSASLPGVGRELFVSDGTVAGTHLVEDLNPGPESSSPLYMTPNGGDLYFVATGGDGDRELYRLTEPGGYVLDLGLGGSGAHLSSTAPLLGSTVTVTVDDAPAGDIGALLMSGVTASNAAFANFGNASWIDPLSFKILGINTVPTWSFAANLPTAPAFVGLGLNLQAWFIDPVSLGMTTSNGLRFELGF